MYDKNETDNGNVLPSTANKNTFERLGFLGNSVSNKTDETYGSEFDSNLDSDWDEDAHDGLIYSHR